MTVFRVNTERDIAKVVGNSIIHTVGIDPKTGRVESLSAISMRYYRSYRFWPLIWKNNMHVELADPNKTKKGMRLVVPKSYMITALDRTYCERIWLRWENPIECASLMCYWISEEIKRRLCEASGGTDCDEPEWMHWMKPLANFRRARETR